MKNFKIFGRNIILWRMGSIKPKNWKFHSGVLNLVVHKIEPNTFKVIKVGKGTNEVCIGWFVRKLDQHEGYYQAVLFKIFKISSAVGAERSRKRSVVIDRSINHDTPVRACTVGSHAFSSIGLGRSTTLTAQLRACSDVDVRRPSLSAYVAAATWYACVPLTGERAVTWT